MKINPSKDYKKPLYAIGLAAAIAVSSLALTGCENPMDSVGDFYTPGLIAFDIDETTSGHKYDADATLESDIPTDAPDEVNETT